jgi:hypothetical protein
VIKDYDLADRVALTALFGAFLAIGLGFLSAVGAL